MEIKQQYPEVTRSGFVGLVGPTNAGKSTLLNTLVGSKLSIVTPKEQTTRNRILGVKTFTGPLNVPSQIVFIDTPGLALKSQTGELNKYLDRNIDSVSDDVDFNLLVIDSYRADRNKEHLTQLIDELDARGLGKPRIVALNKVDLIEKENLLPLLANLAEVFSNDASSGDEPRVELVPISAKTGNGVEQLEQILFDCLPEGPAYFPEGMLSDQPEHFYVSEVIREKLFFNLQQEMPYSTAVVVENWQESSGLLSIHAVILVERDSQKGIVLGKGGAMIKKIGQSARQELERRFGTKVFLKLYVKVEKNWTKSERGLERVGYSRG